jgi:hypothetical protein
MNRGNREGWVQGKPTSNSGKEKELLGSKTHPANTIASGDELAVNSWLTAGFTEADPYRMMHRCDLDVGFV